MLKMNKKRYRTDEQRLIDVSFWVGTVVFVICLVIGYLGNIGVLK